ncbi:hypothetical protein [Streptomyces albus]|nr:MULTISPECIES: hypothetical protein [unclassified Streptomyces]
MRRLHGWKVTADGVFWGGVLMLSIVGGTLAVILVAVARQPP